MIFAAEIAMLKHPGMFILLILVSLSYGAISGQQDFVETEEPQAVAESTSIQPIQEKILTEKIADDMVKDVKPEPGESKASFNARLDSIKMIVGKVKDGLKKSRKFGDVALLAVSAIKSLAEIKTPEKVIRRIIRMIVYYEEHETLLGFIP